MKNPILSTCWLVAGLILTNAPLLTAQESAAPSRYQAPGFFGGCGFVYPIGATLHAGGYGKNGWGAGVVFSPYMRPSEKEPGDYRDGNSIFGLGDPDNDVDPDNFFVLGITAMKVFHLEDYAFASLQAGPSMVWFNQSDNFVPVANPCTYNPLFGNICSPNYTYERVNKFTVGGFFKAALNIKLLDKVGLSPAIFSHIDPDRIHLGAELSIIVGNFRKSKP